MHYVIHTPADTLREILRWSDLVTNAQVGDYLGVNPRTVQLWKQRESAPPWAKRLLIQRTGDLGAINEKWTGWRLWRDELWSPEDQPIGQTGIRMNHIGGSLVTQAERRARLAENRLTYLTQCLAGFMVAQSRPRIDETFTVYTADGRPLELSLNVA